MIRLSSVAPLLTAGILLLGFTLFASAQTGETLVGRPMQGQASPVDAANERTLETLYRKGRDIFRDDTFGSEAFWGGQLQLHRAIAGSANGGVGDGLSPKAALAAGLKVDMDRVPAPVAAGIKSGQVKLDDPANTLALLRADAVVGVRGVFDQKDKLTSVGITCALCHSTVDDSFSAGIGHRLDGWANRDLNVGAVVAMAPNLLPMANALKVDVSMVKRVLTSWGPGKYDALLNMDGKAFRPDGKSGATLLPAAYGLAGVNAHTYTGWGSVPYWNVYVAHTQMHGSGSLYDARLKDASQFPLAAANKLGQASGMDDQITAKLPALQLYQISLTSPIPKLGSFNEASAIRGNALFNGKALCSTCHVPPLFTEPGYNLHTPAEIGIDAFQADRSPTHMYRTTPLHGLWAHQKGGFYHDGRFATLDAVVNHYNNHLKLNLSAAEKQDLIQFLLSI